MDNTITQFILEHKRHSGFDLSVFEESFVEKQFQKIIEEYRLQSIDELNGFLDKNPGIEKTFQSSFHITYSEFFRDPFTFSFIEKVVLPSIVNLAMQNGRREARIWSAACAGGQEAYSLSILFEELKKTKNEDIGCRIFATDISSGIISEAIRGNYHESSVRNVSLARLKNWFNQSGEHYSVKEVIKENVSFSSFDLLDENLSCPPASIFGSFDLIMCSNVLFYYNDKVRRSIVEKLSRCLSHGGYLVTSETERDFLLTFNAIEIIPQSGIFQIRKNK